MANEISEATECGTNGRNEVWVCGVLNGGAEDCPWAVSREAKDAESAGYICNLLQTAIDHLQVQTCEQALEWMNAKFGTPDGGCVPLF